MAAITSTEAARRLGVDRKTIWNWIQAGKLPAIQYFPGSWYWIDETVVDQLMRATERANAVSATG